MASVALSQCQRAVMVGIGCINDASWHRPIPFGCALRGPVISDISVCAMQCNAMQWNVHCASSPFSSVLITEDVDFKGTDCLVHSKWYCDIESLLTPITNQCFPVWDIPLCPSDRAHPIVVTKWQCKSSLRMLTVQPVRPNSTDYLDCPHGVVHPIVVCPMCRHTTKQLNNQTTKQASSQHLFQNLVCWLNIRCFCRIPMLSTFLEQTSPISLSHRRMGSPSQLEFDRFYQWVHYSTVIALHSIVASSHIVLFSIFCFHTII